MFTIGEFSKINRITTKTLRHYDKIDLLKPVKIDPWTGYRYYSPTQLLKMKEILRLKEMGFSLEEIKSITHSKNSIKEMLDRRIKEIEIEIAHSNSMLERIIEYRECVTGGNMKNDIVIKTLPEVIVASMRTIVPSYDTYFDIVPKMGEYMTSVGAICSEPAYCFTIYHDGEYKENDIDVEICEAVEEKCEDSDKVKFKVIPGYKEAASVFHRGPYSSIQESYNKIFSWIHAQGWKVIDNPRESYIDGIWNRDDPKEWLTEIQIPVTKE